MTDASLARELAADARQSMAAWEACQVSRPSRPSAITARPVLTPEAR